MAKAAVIYINGERRETEIKGGGLKELMDRAWALKRDKESGEAKSDASGDEDPARTVSTPIMAGEAFWANIASDWLRAAPMRFALRGGASRYETWLRLMSELRGDLSDRAAWLALWALSRCAARWSSDARAWAGAASDYLREAFALS